jgi:ABC-2 type transport system permease protein
MPEFTYRPPGGAVLAKAALPTFAILIGWLCAAAVLLALATHRLGAR